MTRSRGGAAAVASAAVLAVTTLLPAPASRAADPVADARVEAARRAGVAPDSLRLVYQRSLDAGEGGGAVWAAKFLDASSGRLHAVYRSGDGELGGPEVVESARSAADADRSPLEIKADTALRAAVQRTPDALLPVAVWLDVDTSGVGAAVAAGHPEVSWLAGRPLPESVEQARALRAEAWEARRAIYAAAAGELSPLVEALGGRIGYVSTSAPLVFVDLPARAVEALAGRAEVLGLGLESEWRTAMSSAGPTVGADWAAGGEDQGNGIRVGVVEYHNAVNTGDLAGQVVDRYSTTGQIVTNIHPTWVAGAIGSRSTAWRGIAPGADIVSAGTGGYSPSLATDRAIIAAADWSISPSGGDVDIINASIGQDTATGAEEARRYFDSIVWEDGRLVVAASGNYSTFGNWDVVSPGTGHNVMTVGGVNDRNTGSTADDLLWYAPGSDGAAYRDPSGTAWNAHGDFNKPNLSAPAVSVRTANGTTGSGTSIASPIVAGIAAQLVARAPTLAAWPEGTRAILTAGALRRTPMPGGGNSTDHEGAGTASARWSNLVLDNGAWGGWTVGALTSPGDVETREVMVVAGQPIRVALAWSSHTSGSSNLNKVDVLTADLDLVVRQPNGAIIGSYTFDNAYEVLDLVASSTGIMRIEVSSTRFDAASEPFGLAWALQSPYTDAAGSPFYADILWLAQQQITAGCTPTTFCPRSVVSRAQMASFLVRAMDLPPSGTDHFVDDGGSSHEADIDALAASGITTGCNPGLFCPDAPVSRQQMATFLVRALDLPPSATDYFDDDDGSFHEDDINALAASGITGGCGPEAFCPYGGVTREQMAAFLHRALDG